MTSPPHLTLRVTRRIAAPPERVFDAWLDPAVAGRWLFATPTGRMVRVEIDARVGGRFVFTRRDGEDVEHVGEYLEIDRPRRLAFTFAVPRFSAEETRVFIDIVPVEGGSELTLTQEGVLPEWGERTQEGWTKILGGLNEETTMGDFAVITGPDTVRLERLLPGPIETVWAYLTDPEKRGKWLAAGPMEPRVGGAVELRFRHADLSTQVVPTPERYKNIENGHLAHGHVLRWEPPHVLAYTWNEGTAKPSEVTFELTARGGEVLLVLTHGRVVDRAEMLSLGGGWHAHLRFLADRLNGVEPPAFWSVHDEVSALYAARFGAV